MDAPIVLEPCRRIDGEIKVPGDKSIAHRAVLFGAIGRGRMEIANLSPAADVASSVKVVRGLGVQLEGPANPAVANPNLQDRVEGVSIEGLVFQLLVDGQGRNALISPKEELDVGNSGTTIRLLLGILAAGNIEASLSGDKSIKRRPMKRVIDPLRAMGADIEAAEGGVAPLSVRGRELHGVAHQLEIASAQVKSAILLAGLAAEGTTSVLEPARSRDHTERMLRYLGVHVGEERNRLIVKATEIQNDKVTVPGDFSSAAFLLVAAAITPAARLRIFDVGVNPTRIGLLDLLREYGAEVALTDEREVCGEPVATIEVAAGERKPLAVAGERTVRAIDELPLVALLGAMAEGGVTEIRDAAELRVKESDRIATTAAMLRAFGVSAEVLPDGLVVPGRGSLDGNATIDPAGDHRIAMTAAVAAMAADGPTAIQGWGCVAVSYPGFESDLARVAHR